MLGWYCNLQKVGGTQEGAAVIAKRPAVWSLKFNTICFDKSFYWTTYSFISFKVALTGFLVSKMFANKKEKQQFFVT